MKDELVNMEFMAQAIEKAKEGVSLGQTPFGACIVKDGQVIASAHNSVWRDTDITAHAEVNVIREACQKLKSIDLSGCVLYSTCEPCPMCFSACHWARIETVIFGARIEDAQNAGFNELTLSNDVMKQKGQSPLELVGDVMREENVKLFELWLQQEQRRVY